MISFTIQYPPTKEGKRNFCRRYSLNAYWGGKHWGKRGKDAKDLHQLALASMRQQRIPQKILPYPVEVRFFWNDGLDVDNHAAMGKAFLDAMKGYIIQNDSRKWVPKVSHEFWKGPGILVEVVESEIPVVDDVNHIPHAKVIGDGIDLHKCSRCGHLLPYDANGDTVDYWKCNYCPCCGAKMDGGT